MSKVLVKFGSYRNTPVINQTFKLVKGFQTGLKGGFITVKNEGHFSVPIDIVKIKLNNEHDYVPVIGEGASMVEAVKPATESDEQIMDRIASRFSVLDRMTKACITGDIRALIVTGPPGVGKSFGVVQQLEKAAMFDRLKGNREKFEVIKGAISGIGLFATLYRFSSPKHVLVFDDCDVWDDQDALNVLKGALDSGKKRRISWNKDSRMLRQEDVPSSFDFEGTIIFITNLDFADSRSRKLAKHLEAFKDRCHFLDLTIDTVRDKFLRIKQVHRDADGGLFRDYGFETEQADEVFNFIWKHQDRLESLSMRLALKIADLIKIEPQDWKVFAEATCMKRAVGR